MDDTEFAAKVESREISVDGHEQLLRIAYIYLRKDFQRRGVFVVLQRLYKHNLSFGQGVMKFHRYGAQIESYFS